MIVSYDDDRPLQWTTATVRVRALLLPSTTGSVSSKVVLKPCTIGSPGADTMTSAKPERRSTKTFTYTQARAHLSELCDLATQDR